MRKKNKTGHDDSADLRERAEEALRESEERYKELWERAPVAYHVLDPDGKIAKVNQTEASMLGYQVHEMVGKSIFDFILPEQRDEAQKRFCQKIQGLPIPRIENRIYLKKDGSRIYVVIDDVLERDAQKKITGIRSTMTDITDRKRIEEELLKSEKKYKSLVQTAGSGIATIDQRGIFTLVNETLCRMCGYPEQELIGKHFVDFLHPDDRKNAIQIFENAFINPIGNPYIEFRIIHKDGRIVYMCSNPTAFEYKNQLLGFNAIITDITEHKRAEEEAVQHTKNIEFLSETAMGFVELPAEKDIYWFIGEKLRQLIDDAIYILVNSFDQKTGEIKVRALLADDRNRQAISKTLGAFPLGISFVVSEEAWNGLISGKLVRVPGGIHELSFGKIPKAACDALEKLAGTGDIFTMGFTKKGELYGSATIIMREGSQLSNRDVVETLVRQAGVALQRKRAEEALRESQKRFQALTETTNDFIWEMDANGVYTYCSPQIYELWGYKPEDMIGRTPFELMIPEDREHAIKMFRTISESPSSFKRMETRSRDNTGRIVVLETGGVPFFDIDGRLSGYRGISRDITERKRAEEVVRKSEEKFRSLTENVNLGIYRNTVGPEGKFVEANPAIIEMFGYKSKEEFLAINVSDLYQNPEDRKKFNDKMLKEGFVRGEELQLKKKDGSLLVGSVSVVAVKDKQGHVKYYDGIIEDITERKRVEDALRFTRLSLDNAADTMVCVGHDGRFVDVNDAFCRSAGYSREELLSMTVHDIDPDYSVEVWPEFWKKLKQSGSLTFETCHHTKAEKVIPVEITAKFFEHNGKEYHCGFARDITERKRAEEALKKERQRLFSVLDIMPMFVYLQAPDYSVRFTNRKFRELFGDPGDRPCYEAFYGRKGPCDPCMTLRVLETGAPQTWEWTSNKDRIYMICEDLFPSEDDENLVLEIGVDITERKRAEEELRKSEARFLSYFNMPLHGIAITSADKGWIEVNDRICSILGYTRDELFHKNWAELTHPDDLAADAEQFNRILCGQIEQYAMDKRFIRKDGGVIWTKITVGCVRKSDGNVDYIIGLMEDITERKRAEEALRKSQSQLRALSLELSFIEERERKRLASYLHDEIGQSLALLRMKFGSLAGVWKSKSRKQNIQQIRDLLEKVIDQTHTLTFELSPPVLHQLGLEAAIEWAGEKISQDCGIEFMFRDDGQMKPLDADIKALLFRCVRELMSNTVKHAKAKRMTVSLARREERVFVVVEDDGIGFDMSLPEGQPKRTGFGLFSVRERLGEVGGSYEFHSEPGRGTRMTLSIPLKEEMSSS